MDLAAARESPLAWCVMVSRGGLAALSGVLLALSFPRFDLAPLAFVALIPLLVGLDGVPALQGTYLGIIAGAVFSLMSIPWVVRTMTAYGGLPLPVGVLLLVALSLYLALYVGVFAFGVTRLSPEGGLGYLVGAATLWVGLEYLRTFLLTGFPWNLLGYTQYRSLSIIQVASITGVYGVSFLLVLVNAAVALACLHVRRSARQALMPVLGVGVLLIGTVVFGMGRRVSAEIPLREIRVSVVQGNIEQALKWTPAALDLTLDRYARLSAQAAQAGAELIVWPETAVPLFLRHDPARLAQVRALAESLGRPLLVGAPDRTVGGPVRLQNSAMLLGPDGRLLAKYDKMHLVPFGEYVPLKSILFFVDKLATGIGDFVPGETQTLFRLPGGTFAASICFEVIFPNEVRAAVAGGAEFLVNITNDAWFGRSAAAAQHLRMAAFRALETRRYLARAANTGISAAVDPYGRILASTPLFEEAVLVQGVIPRRDLTPYVRFGDWFAAASSLGAAGWITSAWGAGRRAARRGQTAWRS